MLRKEHLGGEGSMTADADGFIRAYGVSMEQAPHGGVVEGQRVVFAPVYEREVASLMWALRSRCRR